MNHAGGCHCGAIRYEASGAPNSVVICHCVDCRRSSGAPMVSWAEFPEDHVEVMKGALKSINTSGASIRSFCGECGSGIFYRNAETQPGVVEVQTSTLDDPESLVPTVQIQTAERLGWVARLDALPAHARWRR